MALLEVQLLPTKQLIYQVLCNTPRNIESLRSFTDNDFAVLYEQAFDFDSNILRLAFESSDQLNFLTESLVLIQMVQDKKLMNVALVEFLRTNDLMEMLLESNETYTLNFLHNHELSLRTYMGHEAFRNLILTAVDIVKETDPVQCVCLLDKICETKKVL